jgi:ankyrin repeat protein
MGKSKKAKAIMFILLVIAITSCNRETPEEIAAKNELLEQGLKFHSIELERQIRKGNTETVELYLKGGWDVNYEYGYTAGHNNLMDIAVRYGHIDIVRLLVEYGAHVDKGSGRGYTSLDLAAREGHLDIVEYLCSKGAKIYYLAVEYAIEEENFEILEFLLEAESDRSSKQYLLNKALLDVVYYGKTEILELIMNNGAEINYSSDKYRKTAFYLATVNKDITVMRFLLDKGADINFQEKNGKSPLMVASTFKNYTVITDFLLRNGADIDLKDEEEKTAMVYALESEDTFDNAILLIEHGADINTQETRWGWTPLMIAARHNYFDVIVWLIENGADKNIKDKDGRTAYDIAVKAGNEELARMLLNSGV